MIVMGYSSKEEWYMKELNWSELRRKYENNPKSTTKSGKIFMISRITNSAIYIDLPSGEEYISRANLEKAVELINRGQRIEGPSDYRNLVYDQRPAYAWAILRDMGLIG